MLGVLVKPFIAVLMLYSGQGVCASARGVPYIGWAQTCMGLAVAGACAKRRPCYWSQTIPCVNTSGDDLSCTHSREKYSYYPNL